MLGAMLAADWENELKVLSADPQGRSAKPLCDLMSHFHVVQLTTEGWMSGEDEKRFNEPLCAGKRSVDAQ